jgi:SH3-like domain-containing protein
MGRFKVKLQVILLILGLFSWLGITSTIRLNAYAQQPTVAIPTVTSSPSGPMVTVNQDQEQINVRSGPSQDYPIVGVLEQGEKVPALGRSVGGDWVEIVYPVVDGGVAWVYAYLVSISGGELPVIVPPPTPTPRVTPTIDPTLAAQLIIEIGPTRLPTFTQPAALEIPTYTQAPAISVAGGLPLGFIIIGLAVVGLFGLLISVFRGR